VACDYFLQYDLVFPYVQMISVLRPDRFPSEALDIFNHLQSSIS
jgi:hypothetical protein